MDITPENTGPFVPSNANMMSLEDLNLTFQETCTKKNTEPETPALLSQEISTEKDIGGNEKNSERDTERDIGLVLEFFGMVLPPNGPFASVWLHKGKESRTFANSHEDLLKHSSLYDSQQTDAYFSVASFKQNPSDRSGVNVSYLKSLRLDIDYSYSGHEKEYPNLEAARAAAQKFTIDARLPQPVLVDRGMVFMPTGR